VATKRSAIAALLLTTAGALAAPENSSAADHTRAANNANATTEVRVMRATDFMGTDVMSADGRKVGDIVDYVFDVGRPPRLAYVLVMTGGFVDLGGDVRAVPAGALRFDGDTAHIGLTREQYLATPELEGDRPSFLSNPDNVARIDRAFNRSGPVTGAPPPAGDRLIAFSAMNQREADSVSSGFLGYIDDAWISLNRDRAPFVEITPMFQPFEPTGSGRYALPLARLQPGPENGKGFTFAVSVDDLTNAQPASDAPGVEVVQSGFIGDQVLRVTVPAVKGSRPVADRDARKGAATDNTRAQAGAPTGRESASAGADASTTQAARAVRQALDKDANLSHENVQVVPQQGKILLRGSARDSRTRGQIEEAAEEAAHGMTIDNQITTSHQ
jgi:hypothetical protein